MTGDEHQSGAAGRAEASAEADLLGPLPAPSGGHRTGQLREVTTRVVRDLPDESADLMALFRDLVTAYADGLEGSFTGVWLADSGYQLRLVASHPYDEDRLSLLGDLTREGPAQQAAQAATPVLLSSTNSTVDRWPRWTRAAVQAGVHSAYAYPIRVNDRTLGVLGILGDRTDLLGFDDHQVAAGLADGRTASGTREETDRLSARLAALIDTVGTVD